MSESKEINSQLNLQRHMWSTTASEKHIQSTHMQQTEHILEKNSNHAHVSSVPLLFGPLQHVAVSVGALLSVFSTTQIETGSDDSTRLIRKQPQHTETIVRPKTTEGGQKSGRKNVYLAQ